MNKILVLTNYDNDEKVEKYLNGCRMVGLMPETSSERRDPADYDGLQVICRTMASGTDAGRKRRRYFPDLCGNVPEVNF